MLATSGQVRSGRNDRNMVFDEIEVGAIAANTINSSGMRLSTGGSVVDTAEIMKLDALTDDVQGQLDNKHPLTSVDSAVTAGSTNLITSGAVSTALTDLVDVAPDALNTLNELAAAINDDASFAASVTTTLGTKQDNLTLNAAAASGSGNLAFDGAHTFTFTPPNLPTGTPETTWAAYATGTALNAGLATKHPTIDVSNRLGADLIHDGTVSNAEFACLDGVTSSIQTQLNAKASTTALTDGLALKASTTDLTTGLAGKASTTDLTNGLAGKANAADLTNGLAAKHPTISASSRLNANLIGDGSVSDTEFGYLNGVTLGIQTQINGKASTSDLTNGLASKQASIPGTAPSNFNKLVTTADTDLEVPAISGNGGKVLALNSGATALEWTAASSGGGGSSSTVSFFAYGVGGWFTSLATQDTIVLGATQHNLGSGYSTSTGKFTAPSAGVYHFDTNFMVKHLSLIHI